MILAVLVVFYSEIFLILMHLEGRAYSWGSSIYWTLTVMSTLGLGDIVFVSDIGKLFTMLVLLSGLLFLLFLLPAFIQFFYAPWMMAQSTGRVPKQVSKEIKKHVILTQNDAVTMNLIKKLNQYDRPYVLVISNLQEALALHDQGLNVVHGSLDHPETSRLAKMNKAALVVCTLSDTINTNFAFTVRQTCKHAPIITTADSDESVDILKQAGSNHVLQVHDMMGRFLARRTNGGERAAHVIGRIDELLIAEADVTWTSLVGKTLEKSQLRENIGINVIGVWDHGWFELAKSSTVIRSNTVLVMACSQKQLDLYNKTYGVRERNKAPVIIIGAGRVGRVTAKTLKENGIDYRVIEKNKSRIGNGREYVHGDAASLEVLKEAGFMNSTSVIITTHDDDTNIYLTIYFRKLRPDIQIISRSTLARNVDTLHRAGADFVTSYASMGANAIFNILNRCTVLMIAEGLNVFKVKTPPLLIGKSLSESMIRQKTGCSVIALEADGEIIVNPEPNFTFPHNSEIVLIGNVNAESRFLEKYKAKNLLTS
jgi:Trk K+ transport system NAD-binding subunit